MDAEALTATKNPLDLVQSVDKAPYDTAIADVLTEATHPFLAMPAANLSQTMGKTTNDTATADALTEATYLFPAIPAMNSPQIMGKDPMKWQLSAPLETHFNEVCPINLLGEKCKCDLVHVNLKVSS